MDKFELFFRDYSKNVDKANDQYFWRLSDDLILKILTENIGNSLNENSTILDAGGGTGRWIQVLSKIYQSKFVLYDKSASMIAVAKKKKDLQKLGKRLRILQGDIQNMNKVDSTSIDCVISIYNPISFVKKPELFFKEIKRILKFDGIAVIMGQGYHNAIGSKINNYLADSQELKQLDRNMLVKWNSSLAPLNVFSKESFQDFASHAGLKVKVFYGVPVFVQPGPEDFDSKNKQRSRVSSKLEKDPDFYREVFNIEMENNSKDSMINRGMNIMAIVKKQ